jgi:hypothetical protein
MLPEAPMVPVESQVPFTCPRRRAPLASWRAATCVALVMALPTLARAQPAVEEVAAKGVAAFRRFTEHLVIPRRGTTGARLDVELASWTLEGPSHEITIPAQGFYVAELRSDDIVTVIDGHETPRRGGDLWVVQDGQSMVVRFGDPKQQGATLRILSLRPSP